MKRRTRSGLSRLLVGAWSVGVTGLLAAGPGVLPARAQGKMTEQGTPRAETLVMDQLNGRVANARLFNPYVPGVEINNGLKPLFPPLWEMDTMKGEQFPAVAAEPLKALNAGLHALPDQGPARHLLERRRRVHRRGHRLHDPDAGDAPRSCRPAPTGRGS